MNMKTKVDEWKKRKAIHEVDPIELLKNNQAELIKYLPIEEQREYLNVQIKCHNVVLATTRRAVIANRRYYIPAHDIKYKYFEPSNKRHR